MPVVIINVLLFQSTLPHGSDPPGIKRIKVVAISIHAPSRERPIQVFMLVLKIQYFNPRSLTGATWRCMPKRRAVCLFQSTLPHGSDPLEVIKQRKISISIHAPSRERQKAVRTSPVNIFNFNPRSLTGATIAGIFYHHNV